MNDARCRLFLVSPEDPDLEAFPAMFAQAARAGDIASLLIRPTPSRGDTIDLISATLPTGYDENIAILVEGDAELAAEAGADGVQVTGGLDDFKAARSLLGSDRIVGVLSNGLRHDCMEFGEAGADYIAFHQNTPVSIGSGETREDVNVLEWWSDLFEIPAVAFDPVAIAEVERLVHLGANFIRPEDAIWSSPGRAADTVKRYNARIDEFVQVS